MEFGLDTKNRVQKFKSEGFQDIHAKQDGCLLKRILRKGNESIAMHGTSKPVDGCPTRIHYVGWLFPFQQGQSPEDPELIFETTRERVNGTLVGGTDDPVEFMLGRPEVTEPSAESEGIDRTLNRPPGLAWDICVQTMCVGELCELVVLEPSLAYGTQGHPPKVLPNSIVRFEVELVSWGASIPRFPSPEEIAHTRKEREAEETKQLKENPPPTLNERLQEAIIAKEEGNTNYKAENYDEAKKAYDKGFVNLFFDRDTWDALPPHEKEQVESVRFLLHLNRSIVKLKLGDVEAAEWDSEQAVKLDPTSSKAIYRRATVFVQKLKLELAKEERGEFWILDKAWAYYEEARQSIAKLLNMSQESRTDKGIRMLRCDLDEIHKSLKLCSEAYKQQQKELYHNKMFRSLEAKNSKLRASVTNQDDEDGESSESDDIPELEE